MTKGTSITVGGFAVFSTAAMVAIAAGAACSSDDAEADAGGPKVDSGPITNPGDGATGDTGSDCPPLAARTCTATACTAQLGEPATCVHDACVKIKSTECQIVYGPSDNDNALYVASVQDLLGGSKGTGLASMNASQLAVQEINQNGGLRDPDRCKPSHPIVLVGCNESNFNADGTAYKPPPGDAGTELSPPQRMVEHIAGELDIPIMFGGTTSGDTLVINNYMMPKYKRVFISTRGSSPIFEHPTSFDASPDGTRLFWRTTGNAGKQTPAMRLVLAEIVEEVKAKYTTTTVKVALLNKNDAFGVGTAATFEDGLMVNGAPAGGSNVNANYLHLAYRERPGVDTGTPTGGQPEQDDAVTQLKAFAPDVIVFISTDEFVNGTVGVTDPHNTGILKPYEDYLQATPAARHPYYLHSAASNGNALTAYNNNFANFGNDAAIRKDYLNRTRGTNVGQLPTTLGTAFFNRYKGVYDTPTELIYGMPESYDAAYIAAYLYAGTFWRPEPVTSLALAKTFPSLVEGTLAVDNGPGALNDGVQALTTDGKINYNGATNTFEWDYTTGEAPYNLNVWCIQVNPATNKLFYQQNAGELWNYQTGKLEGTYTCPQQ